jgi:uncharacterized protein YdhG (YjbR/CyaY superfamily)
MSMSKAQSIDEYIAQCPPTQQTSLIQLRQIILNAAPEATEKISFGMPGFALHGKLVWFAANKNHIGFYPVYGLEHLEDELAVYRGKGTKDALHFKYNEPLPVDLITKMVQYKVAKNLEARPKK